METNWILIYRECGTHNIRKRSTGKLFSEGDYPSHIEEEEYWEIVDELKLTGDEVYDEIEW